MAEYDLLIKGGRVADYLTKTDGVRDVAVKYGQIVSVSEEISEDKAARVINADGLAVLPGVADLHTHIASQWGGGTALAMLARAGVTTALDCGGPLDLFLECAKNQPVGINIACIQSIRPGVTVSSTSPPISEFAEVLDRSLDSGAIGLKLLGGHYPMTPEATADAIQACNNALAYVCFHVGTLATGAGTLTSFREAVALAGNNHLHLAHVNSYCRGQVLGDPIAETAEVLKTLDGARNLISEAYLSIFSGSPGKCVDGRLESLGPRNSLSMAGYGDTEAEMSRAILEGFAGVVAVRGDENIVLHGQEAHDHWRRQKTNVTCTFPVTPAATRSLLAFTKVDGRFVVDALSTDGGGIPRNFILSKGLALVHLDFMTLIDFTAKTSYFPCQILGLKTKGSCSEGFDADLTLVDLEARRPVMTLVAGEPAMVNGILMKRPPVVITTARGSAQVRKQGLPVTEILSADSWFYTGRPV